MKTKITILSLCAIMMFGCEKVGKISGAIRNVGVSFYVQNSSGDNLMSPQTPSYWKAEDLKLYYLNDKQEKVIDYNGSFVRPTFDFFNIPGDRYVLDIYFHTTFCEPYCVSYLAWPNGEVDTLEGKFESGPNWYSIVEVKINGEVMWSTTGTSTIDKNGNFAVFNKVITDKGSKISLFTDHTYRQ